MKLRNKAFFIALGLLLMLFVNILPAQTVEPILSDSVVTELQQQKPYSNYFEIEDRNDNLLARIKSMLSWFFSRIFNNKVSYSFANVLPYLIVVAVLIIIALKFTGLSMSGIMKSSSTKISQVGEFNENQPIQKNNFKQLINTAVADENYRVAIRYSYLLLLQGLDANGYIEWERQKSNYDYLLKVKNSPFYTDFSSVTLVYENAWYGEMPWSNTEYKQHFDNMITQVSTINKSLA